MIALDTNVLVRYLVRDNLEQAEAARDLLEGLTPEAPGFISREVTIETAWVLERSYRFSREQIADVLEELTAVHNLIFEAGDDVARVALRFRQGGPDFADLMILGAAEPAGAQPLYTFDQTLARSPGAVLVTTNPA
jgi:predicted nucleic-acid-binding protein